MNRYRARRILHDGPRLFPPSSPSFPHSSLSFHLSSYHYRPRISYHIPLFTVGNYQSTNIEKRPEWFPPRLHPLLLIQQLSSSSGRLTATSTSTIRSSDSSSPPLLLQ